MYGLVEERERDKFNGRFKLNGIIVQKIINKMCSVILNKMEMNE